MLYTKINSKYITDLTIKCKTIKLPEGNIGDYLVNLEIGHNFLGIAAKALSMGKIIDF